VHVVHICRATDRSTGKPSSRLTNTCFVSVEIGRPSRRPKSTDSSKFELSINRPDDRSFVRATVTVSF